MRYLHTMLRVSNLDKTMSFFCDIMGMREVKRMESDKGRFTLVFLAASGDVEGMEGPGQPAPVLELTYNWDPKNTPAGVISVMLPSRWMIFTPLARRLRTAVSPSIVRRGTATWHSCVRRIISPSNCCRRVVRGHRRSRGRLRRMLEPGNRLSSVVPAQAGTQ